VFGGTLPATDGSVFNLLQNFYRYKCATGKNLSGIKWVHTASEKCSEIFKDLKNVFKDQNYWHEVQTVTTTHHSKSLQEQGVSHPNGT